MLDKAWVPLGSKDYSSVIAKIPKDVDALLVVLGGADAVNFLTQYEKAGGDKPMLGGSITVDQDGAQLQGQAPRVAASARRRPARWPIARRRRVEGLRRRLQRPTRFADGFPSPSLFAYVYYINMKATLDGLDAVKGDLSGNQAKYREALSKMVLKTPTGDVKLDANRQAIGTTFVTEVVKDSQGNLFNKVNSKVDNVEQTLGMSEGRVQDRFARRAGLPVIWPTLEAACPAPSGMQAGCPSQATDRLQGRSVVAVQPLEGGETAPSERLRALEWPSSLIAYLRHGVGDATAARRERPHPRGGR